MKKTKKELSWTIHIPSLLQEIADCGLRENMGVLKVPLNTIRRSLLTIAELAQEIDDPRLHELMCCMTLYECADPYSKEYDKNWREKIQELKDKKGFGNWEVNLFKCSDAENE